MADPEIIKYIVDRLSAHADPDEITYTLCEKHGLNWDDAYSMVFYAQTQHADVIAKRQFPVMLTLALATFVGGVVVIAWAILRINNYISLFIDREIFVGMRANIIIELVDAAPGYFGVIGLGLAMVLGSIIGMRQVWAKLLFGE